MQAPGLCSCAGFQGVAGPEPQEESCSPSLLSLPVAVPPFCSPWRRNPSWGAVLPHPLPWELRGLVAPSLPLTHRGSYTLLPLFLESRHLSLTPNEPLRPRAKAISSGQPGRTRGSRGFLPTVGFSPPAAGRWGHASMRASRVPSLRDRRRGAWEGLMEGAKRRRRDSWSRPSSSRAR